MKNGTESVKKGFETVSKSFESFSGFGKEGMEAYMKSATAWAKAFEQINSEVATFSKQQMEDGVAAFKAVAGAKSVHEAWEVQTDFAKTALDAYVAQTTKLNDLWLEAAKQSVTPFSSGFATFAEKLKDVKVPFGRAAE